MYHHNHHHQEKNFASSRMSERHLFLQGGNGPGETGLVLSTDAKPRLKWTSELHERFIEAVSQLGGADKATPKTVMKLMGVPGLTLYHLKSHLQKYRLSKNLHGQANTGTNKNAAVSGRISEENGTHMSNTTLDSQTNKNFQISDALHMQIEVQRRLHEQLEVQRHLQLRIEAQGKYLQSVLEKAQETLERQNLGSAGLKVAKVQLSDLVSKVSPECQNSSFSGLKELPGLCPPQTQTTQPADCSMDSCLTSCEGSQKDQETHNIGMGLRPYPSNAHLGTKGIGEDPTLEHIQPTWHEDPNENKMFPFFRGRDTERIMFPIHRSSSDLSMSLGHQGEKESGVSSISEVKLKERHKNDNVLDQIKTRIPAIPVETGKTSKAFRLPYVTAKLDLNAHDENAAASSCKQFDLNGFSWT